MKFFDSETVGKTGPAVLLQYAVDDGPIILHEVFHERISKTLQLLEYITSSDGGPVCIFNAVFDWFHVVKLYNICRVFSDSGYDDVPTPQSFAEVDAANPSTFCLRPSSCLDLMLYARKGPFQYAMNRKPILLKRVPKQVAEQLAEELTTRIKLPPICFSKKPYEWKVTDADEGFSDIKLTFAPSSSLSAICEAVLGEKKDEFPIPKEIMPTEVSWRPFGQHGKKPWLSVITSHIAMWNANSKARRYAHRDIDLLRRLYHGLDCPPAGDVDSELACAVGAARWRGFQLDQGKLGALKEKYATNSKAFPRGPRQVKAYLSSVLSPAERATLTSTKKAVLESLSTAGSNAAVMQRAAGVLAARAAKIRLTLVEKLLKLPSWHPDFRVIGTKSNRQSGGSEDKSSGGSINPQGIPNEADFRACFTLAYPGEVLEGGDADSYEVTIVDAICKCPRLHEELLSGKKFHGLMGNIWYGVTYEEIMATKGTGRSGIYDRVKGADFAWFYQAQAPKLASVLNILEEDVEQANERMKELYPEVIEKRASTAKSFCSMRQRGGLGSAIDWHEPAEYVESMFRFRRYFTLENNICRELYKLAERPPGFINACKDKIVRREERGAQTVGGATRSSIFAAAFAIQQANMRAACNHEIQSPGGEMTKRFQLAFWHQQPIGVSTWRVRTLNIHDEILVVHDGTVDCKKTRDDFLTEHRKHVPLLAWTWERMESWANK